MLLPRYHRASLPVLCFLELGLGLVLKTLLVGDCRRDLLLRPHQLRSHVENDLVEHLLGLLEFRDRRIHIGAEQCRYSIEYVHGVELKFFYTTANAEAKILLSPG